MPATAVGSANGMSTIASSMRRPGNRYRTSAQTTSDPTSRLTSAAANESPNDNSNAWSTRRLVTAATKALNERAADFRNNAASGIRTINDNQRIVVPSVIPKPGMTLRRDRPIVMVLLTGSGH